MRDTRHHSPEKPLTDRLGQVAEPQRIHQKDRPRAHRENIAKDPANARRRALEGLNGGRMIVAFDLETDREAVTDINDPRILFARLDQKRALIP